MSKARARSSALEHGTILFVTTRDTKGDTTRSPGSSDERSLGAVVLFSGVPRFLPMVIDARGVGIGRDEPIGALLGDERLSRRHAEIIGSSDAFVVRDLGSRNGTQVDGERIERELRITPPAVLRCGGTVILLVADVSVHVGRSVRVERGLVVGRALGDALAEVDRAGASGATLLLRGETGTGKEIAARRFHDNGPSAKGPLVAINCAAIPPGIAESHLFGSKRGAFSGATDSDGALASANGGTVFLDEVGELELAVQGKLLRALETREVVALGSSKPKQLDVRFCCATHRDLRADVESGRFRADLYYRLCQREVVLPPLRDRREEIPWLFAQVAAEVDGALTLHARMIEECLCRPWPGNVRELTNAARTAAESARGASSSVVRIEHLDPLAGASLDEGVADAPARDARPKLTTAPSDEEVRVAVESAGGNVSAAARQLGLHRTQLRRVMRRLGLTSGRA